MANSRPRGHRRSHSQDFSFPTARNLCDQGRGAAGQGGSGNHSARLLQIGGVEPLGEGGEQLGQPRACLRGFRAAPAEASERRHGAQLQRAGSLAAGAVDGGMEQRFRSFARVGRRSVGAAGLGEDQLGVDAVDLGLVVALTGCRDQRFAPLDQLARLGEATDPRLGRREVGVIGGPSEARFHRRSSRRGPARCRRSLARHRLARRAPSRGGGCHWV